MTIDLPDPFVDERGSISNLLSIPKKRLGQDVDPLGLKVGNVALIRSPRGAIRSNHYHREDWHYLYVLSGRMLYFEREVGAEHVPTATWVSKGRRIFTPANREHAVLFLDDSEILSMARNPQTHAEHEADVVRVPFLSREYADALLKEYP